jgi:hypothetical protein
MRTEEFGQQLADTLFRQEAKVWYVWLDYIPGTKCDFQIVFRTGLYEGSTRGLELVYAKYSETISTTSQLLEHLYSLEREDCNAPLERRNFQIV